MAIYMVPVPLYINYIERKPTMTDLQLANTILNKYIAAYPDADDIEEYTEWVYDMNRAELEEENALITD
jgi:hypothetical protein